jgi:N-acetylneuraminate lyase
MLLCGLAAGADGGIGTTYNFMFPIINEIYTRFKANDIDGAREAQKKADKIINAVIKHVTIPATKVILEEMGFDVGYASFPMKKYSPEMRKVILSDAREAGLEI